MFFARFNLKQMENIDKEGAWSAQIRLEWLLVHENSKCHWCLQNEQSRMKLLLIQISKTDEVDDEWSLQQEEFRKLIKNWESFDQLKFYLVLENLGEFEEFEIDFGELWLLLWFSDD